MKPYAFKVRGECHYTGKKGGRIRKGSGGMGALWYEDKTFTVAATQDKYIAQPMNPNPDDRVVSPTITTCKGSKGGSSMEAVDELIAIHAAQSNLSSTPMPTPNETSTIQYPQKPLRYFSVCSGIEAASVAWHALGWTPVGFSEIEPFPSAVLKHRFPNTKNYGDLTKYAEWPVSAGDVDVLIGGTPCQSFSCAGLRKGIADPRGNLALVFLGLADKLKPRFIIWENVVGFLSSDGGRAAGSFFGGLAQLGYGWAYRVLDSQSVGTCEMHRHGRGWDPVPQRRRRVILVACLGDEVAAAKILFEPESLGRNPAEKRKTRKGTAPGPQDGSGAGSLWPAEIAPTLDASFGRHHGQDNQHLTQNCGLFVPADQTKSQAYWNGDEVSGTITTKSHEQNMPDKGNLQAIVESKPIVLDRAAFNQGENAKWDPSIQASDTVPTIVARGPHAVAIPIQDTRAMEKQQGGLGVGKEGDPSYTLDTTGAQGVGHQVPFRKSKRAQSDKDDETWVADEKANTLNVFDQGDTRTTHVVVEGHTPDIAPTLTSSGPPFSRTGNSRVESDALIAHPVVPLDAQNLLSRLGPRSVNHNVPPFDPSAPMYTLTCGSPHALLMPMAVRRLTPTECLRLQGFPDDWTLIPWKGKAPEDTPDGPQYKAAGNSMSTNVIRWIGLRICLLEGGKL